MIYLAVSTQYLPVTDRQTDRRTDGPTSCDSIVRAMHTHRAVKKFQFETKQRPLAKVVFTDI